MIDKLYSMLSTETLQDLYQSLVEWCLLHPEDEDAPRRLQLIAEELKKRGVIP